MTNIQEEFKKLAEQHLPKALGEEFTKILKEHTQFKEKIEKLTDDLAKATECNAELSKERRSLKEEVSKFDDIERREKELIKNEADLKHQQEIMKITTTHNNSRLSDLKELTATVFKNSTVRRIIHENGSKDGETDQYGAMQRKYSDKDTTEEITQE